MSSVVPKGRLSAVVLIQTPLTLVTGQPPLAVFSAVALIQAPLTLVTGEVVAVSTAKALITTYSAEDSKMTIGQYTPQTALGRVDFGMRAARAGKDPMAELQTLAMNDQLLRQREQEMHMKSLEAQTKQQEAALKVQTDEATRLNGITAGVQDYFSTNGKYLSNLMNSGDQNGVENVLHSLSSSLNASPEEILNNIPGGIGNLSAYASDMEDQFKYQSLHDEKSLSDAALETQKSGLTEGRDIRGDARDVWIAQKKADYDALIAQKKADYDAQIAQEDADYDARIARKVEEQSIKDEKAKTKASQLREDTITAGGKFDAETVQKIYSRGMGDKELTQATISARSVLTKLLLDKDITTKEMKSKQIGGIKMESLSLKFGVALQKQYTKLVDADTFRWNSMTPGQWRENPHLRPLTPDEYRMKALEHVVSMTTLDGEPQALKTKKLIKDQQIFANEMMRSPDPVIVEEVGVVMDLLFTTEPYRRMSQALNEGRITQAQALKLEEEMLQEILVAKFYGNPVVRGMVTGSEFQKSKKSVRQIRNKGR